MTTGGRSRGASRDRRASAILLLAIAVVISELLRAARALPGWFTTGHAAHEATAATKALLLWVAPAAGLVLAGLIAWWRRQVKPSVGFAAAAIVLALVGHATTASRIPATKPLTSAMNQLNLPPNYKTKWTMVETDSEYVIRRLSVTAGTVASCDDVRRRVTAWGQVTSLPAKSGCAFEARRGPYWMVVDVDGSGLFTDISESDSLALQGAGVG